MSLFVCSQCSSIENTALSRYWFSNPKLCSDCDPELKGWHGRFPQQKFNNKEWRYIEEGGQFVEKINI